jgi:hypothetical protein
MIGPIIPCVRRHATSGQPEPPSPRTPKSRGAGEKANPLASLLCRRGGRLNSRISDCSPSPLPYHPLHCHPRRDRRRRRRNRRGVGSVKGREAHLYTKDRRRGRGRGPPPAGPGRMGRNTAGSGTRGVIRRRRAGGARRTIGRKGRRAKRARASHSVESERAATGWRLAQPPRIGGTPAQSRLDLLAEGAARARAASARESQRGPRAAAAGQRRGKPPKPPQRTRAAYSESPLAGRGRRSRAGPPPPSQSLPGPGGEEALAPSPTETGLQGETREWLSQVGGCG